MSGIRNGDVKARYVTQHTSSLMSSPLMPILNGHFSEFLEDSLHQVRRFNFILSGKSDECLQQRRERRCRLQVIHHVGDG